MKTLKYIPLVIFAIFSTSCEKPNSNFSQTDSDFSQTDSKIIFISRRIENSADWNLFIMNSDGTQQEKITGLTVRCEKPVVSHAGKTVLFVHYTEDHFYELYSINADGTDQTLIDRADRYCGSADWAPDDSKIIYSKSRNESTDDKDIIIYDFITGTKVSLTGSGNNFSARFSQNNKIAYCQQDNTSTAVYLMNIDGSGKQLIIQEGSNLVWSPDGRRIAYVSRGEIGSPQIFVANENGTNSRQLTKTYLPSWDSGFPPFGNYNPHWTPDGKKIVYQSDINDSHPEIYIMNSDGTNQTRLTNTDRRNDDPEISSGGEFILFSSNRDLNFGSEIYIMNINGKNQNPLSKYAGDDSFPTFRTN